MIKFTVHLTEKEPIITKTFKQYSRDYLCRKLGISYRDFRLLLIEVSAFEPRDDCILVSFGEINGIILSNSIYLVYEGSSIESFVNVFPERFLAIYSLEKASVFSDHLELLILEVVISEIVTNLQGQFKEAKGRVMQYLDQPEAAEAQTQLAACQHQFLQINSDCQRAEMALTSILESPADLAMCSFVNQKILHERRHLEKPGGGAAPRMAPPAGERDQHHPNPAQANYDTLPLSHESIADIIELYLFLVRTVSTESAALMDIIESKSELAELELDQKRNGLMHFELKVAFLSLGVDCANSLASMYGSNVFIPQGDLEWFFWLMAAVCLLLIGLVYFACLAAQTILERRAARGLKGDDK